MLFMDSSPPQMVDEFLSFPTSCSTPQLCFFFLPLLNLCGWHCRQGSARTRVLMATEWWVRGWGSGGGSLSLSYYHFSVRFVPVAMETKLASTPASDVVGVPHRWFTTSCLWKRQIWSREAVSCEAPPPLPAPSLSSSLPASWSHMDLYRIFPCRPVNI